MTPKKRPTLDEDEFADDDVENGVDEDEDEDDLDGDAEEVDPWIGTTITNDLLGSERVTYMEVEDVLGTDIATDLLTNDGRRWVVHVTGQLILKGKVDIKRLWELLQHWGKVVRHTSAKLYPSQGHWPSVTVANAYGSVIIELTVGIDEAPVEIEGEEEDDVYPTIRAGEFLTALVLNDSDDPEEIDRTLRPLKGHAIQSYANLVTYLAENGLEADIYVPRPDNEAGGEVSTREVVAAKLDLDRAVRDRNLLERQPDLKTDDETVIGILDHWSYTESWAYIKGEFPKGDVRVTFAEEDEELRARLYENQGKRIEAKLKVTRPEFDWLPKARNIKTRRVLTTVRHFTGEVPEAR